MFALCSWYRQAAEQVCFGVFLGKLVFIVFPAHAMRCSLTTADLHVIPGIRVMGRPLVQCCFPPVCLTVCNNFKKIDIFECVVCVQCLMFRNKKQKSTSLSLFLPCVECECV